VLTAAAVLMWVESVLPGRFALLDGSAIDWTVYRGRALMEAGLWLLVLVGSWLAAARLRGLLTGALVCLVFAQLGALGLGVASGRDEPAAGGDGKLAQLATLSSERNVVLLILDAVQRDYVTEILQADAQLRSQLRGFRLFTDHLAAFPTTRFSIPAMLSGRMYDNRTQAQGFVEEAYRGEDSVAHPFRAAGFDIGIASTVGEALKLPAHHRVGVNLSQAVREGRGWSPGLELLDLALFRSAPIFAKEWLFNQDEWRLRALSGGSRHTFHATRSLKFLGALGDAFRGGNPRPSLRLIHVGGAHPPVVVDRKCRYIGVQRLEEEAYRAQVECALRQVRDLVDRLETLGLLDRTFLAVTSDHGVRIVGRSAIEQASPTLASAMQRSGAFLMIKPFGAEGELTFDQRPTSAQDLPFLLARAIDGWDAPDEAALSAIAHGDRVRPYMHHAWQKGDWRKPHLTSLFRFEVGAGASSVEAWTYLETISGSGLSEAARAEQRAIELSFAGVLPPT